jgi:hypothetical protein
MILLAPGGQCKRLPMRRRLKRTVKNGPTDNASMENELELILADLTSPNEFAMRHKLPALDSLCDQHEAGSVIAERLDSLPILTKKQIHVPLIHDGLHLMDTQTVKPFKSASHVDRLSVYENSKSLSV